MYNICKVKETTNSEETNILLEQGWHLLDIKILLNTKKPSTFIAVLGWDRRKSLPAEE